MLLLFLFHVHFSFPSFPQSHDSHFPSFLVILLPQSRSQLHRPPSSPPFLHLSYPTTLSLPLLQPLKTRGGQRPKDKLTDFCPFGVDGNSC
jgi:hypothetical protein